MTLRNPAVVAIRPLFFVAALLIAGRARGQEEVQGPPEPVRPAAAPAPARLFDEAADPTRDIAAALALAKKENHRILVVWGANWCTWCSRLDALSKSDPNLKRELLSEYDVVHVDVGRLDKNLELAASYGLDIGHSTSIPCVTILDADGKTLVSQGLTALELRARKRKGHDPAKVLDLLVRYQAPYPEAEPLLAAALAAAKAGDKRVFAYFTKPGSEAGRDLQTWLESAPAAALLAKDFVIAKIDVQRTIGGGEMHGCLRADGENSLPWFAVLDVEGHPLATSAGADGKNIQFPSDPVEIEYFQAMLRRGARRLVEAEILELASSITDLTEKTSKDKEPEKEPGAEKEPHADDGASGK